MDELRALTVQYRDGRWVGWLSDRSTCNFNRGDCCNDGHSTCEGAARHAADLVAADAVRVWTDAAKIPGTWAHEVLGALA